MSGDFRTSHDTHSAERDAPPLSGFAAAAAGVPSVRGHRSPPTPSIPGSIGNARPDSRLAIEIRGLVEAGRMDEARERFAELVTAHQRRASRIAYQYLRDVAEADEAVQDAFVKVFAHIRSYRETWPFEVWFTRILINGCLDRRKARARRDRWFSPVESSTADGTPSVVEGRSHANPEQLLLARERRARIAAAVDRLDGRQRTTFMLCHYGDYTPREISAMTGLTESTVRVHLFRAARKLRALLGGKP